MSEREKEMSRPVTWSDIQEYGEGIHQNEGGAGIDEVKKMLNLFDRLDESTLPEGVKFPLGYEDDEKERA